MIYDKMYYKVICKLTIMRNDFPIKIGITNDKR